MSASKARASARSHGGRDNELSPIVRLASKSRISNSGTSENTQNNYVFHDEQHMVRSSDDSLGFW